MYPNIFGHKPKKSTVPLFDETFLRRLERLNFRTVPSLRGVALGERRSRNLRPALDFSDHRAYSAGDDLRHVDWHAYGRQGELFVKLGEATQSVNIHILLDRSRSMSWEPSRYSETVSANTQESTSKWDVARRLAGALGYLGLSGGESVQITTFADTLDERFGPTRGKRQVIPTLQFLSALTVASPSLKDNSAKEKNGLVQSLGSYAYSHPRGGVLVLISDMLDTADPLNTTDYVEALSGGLLHFPPPRWQVLVMHVLTTEEMQPTLEGDFDLRDVETGESLPFHLSKDTLAQYRLRVRHWCAGLQSACAKRGAAYSRILAEWPLEQKLIPYLRERGVVK